MILNNALELSHEYAARAVKPGDTAVDATAGKGRDTLFLADLTGADGRVYSFDVQQEAISLTRGLLDKNGGRGNVFLINDGHENMERHIDAGVSCVMFNLGYLPGSDRKVQTSGPSTIKAIEASMRLLRKGGLITIVIYHGGCTGYAERDMVIDLCASIDPGEFDVVKYAYLNQRNDPPIFVCIEKKV
ncbi:MAG: methyltransferase domain-containing protein [Clostridia bacterium]|nr:methyltransferase domain-containing protein [Clostridia bacterium]